MRPHATFGLAAALLAWAVPGIAQSPAPKPDAASTAAPPAEKSAAPNRPAAAPSAEANAPQAPPAAPEGAPPPVASVQQESAADATTTAPPPVETVAPPPAAPPPAEQPTHHTPGGKPKKRKAKSYYAFLEYNMSMPVGATHDFAGNFSGRGASVDFRLVTSPRMTVGVRAGWHVFSDDLRSTETQGGITVTSTQLRNLNAVPVTFALDYYLAPRGRRGVIPYAGIGIGPYYAERVTDVSFFSITQDGWHFGITPEVGIMVPLVRSLMTINTRFNYFFEADTSDEAYFSFNVGLDL